MAAPPARAKEKLSAAGAANLTHPRTTPRAGQGWCWGSVGLRGLGVAESTDYDDPGGSVRQTFRPETRFLSSLTPPPSPHLDNPPTPTHHLFSSSLLPSSF